MTNSPVAMPLMGTSHLASVSCRWNGLVQMSFWSSARWIRNLLSLG